MPHLVTNQPWGIVDVVLHEGRVFFRQDWYYIWQVRPPLVPWTQPEKSNLHNTMDRQIWAAWSNRIRIPVRLGASPNQRARDFVALTRGSAPINFDIHWVLRPGHWTVTAIKTAAGSTDRANVDFAARAIEFFSHELPPRGAVNEAGVVTNTFRPAPHEFGHTIDADDEYQAASANLPDTQSIMNIGGQVRPRHIRLIVDTLNTAFAGCVFSLPASV